MLMKMLSRVPKWADTSVAGMTMWFTKMCQRGLLFHPDDDPATIFRIADGKRIFSKREINSIQETISNMFKIHMDKVYEAAYPSFMTTVGK
jgi:hypothetical protein